MRATATALALILSATPAFAETYPVEAPVTAATVFPDGATVTRSLDFAVPAGRHTLLIADVPRGFDPNSLRASGEGSGAFSILSVERREGDPAAAAAVAQGEAEKIRTAVERLEDQVAAARATIAAAENQIAFVEATIEATRVSGKREGAAPSADDTVMLWRQSAEATREALAAKQQALIEIRRLERQIEQLSARAPAPTRDVPEVIAVEIEAEAPVEGEVTLEHFTSAASWGAVYDARLDSEADALTLVRRAQVQQRTGEAWRDVALTLSTARPTGRTQAVEPRVPVAMLQEDRLLRQQRGFGGGVMGLAAPAPMAVMEAEADMAAPLDVQAKRARVVAAAPRVQGEAVVYDIAARADIPGSGTVRQVLVGEETFEAQVELRAAPVVDPTAYLTAVFENGDGLILPGEVSLLRDGLYVGKGRLPLIARGEEGAVGFGALESVQVARRVLESESADSRALPEEAERRMFELGVENTGDKARTVVLYDAMPVARSGEIEVERLGDAPDEARTDDLPKGRLAWVLEVAPGEEAEVAFGYEVRYPLGRDLILR